MHVLCLPVTYLILACICLTVMPPSSPAFITFLQCKHNFVINAGRLRHALTPAQQAHPHPLGNGLPAHALYVPMVMQGRCPISHHPECKHHYNVHITEPESVSAKHLERHQPRVGTSYASACRVWGTECHGVVLCGNGIEWDDGVQFAINAPASVNSSLSDSLTPPRSESLLLMCVYNTPRSALVQLPLIGQSAMNV
ncbi:hypothetical protein OE88DRAFT_1643872 [Heliocybe sulcata]|uniref:Uncharacterized protein n=1 Tax=Heliocybe sulcata TaxID=5364 RepID=A0A5C3N9U3_9AGAM|nr:hypothetical protein OE88DRAFT_1643872 [Heliocybe sulcata]